MGNEEILKIGDKVKFRDKFFGEENEIEGEITYICNTYVTVKCKKNGTFIQWNILKDRVKKVEPTFYFAECTPKYERPIKLIKHNLSSFLTTKNDNLLYPYPKIDKIEEGELYTTFMWKNDNEPTVLKIGLEETGDLREAFLYAFFYKTMKEAKGWSKTKAKKFLDNLKTEEEKRILAHIEKENKKIQEKERMQKEHEQKVIKLAKRELKKKKLEQEVEEKIAELKKSKRGRKKKC